MGFLSATLVLENLHPSDVASLQRSPQTALGGNKSHRAMKGEGLEPWPLEAGGGIIPSGRNQRVLAGTVTGMPGWEFRADCTPATRHRLPAQPAGSDPPQGIRGAGSAGKRCQALPLSPSATGKTCNSTAGRAGKPGWSATRAPAPRSC